MDRIKGAADAENAGLVRSLMEQRATFLRRVLERGMPGKARREKRTERAAKCSEKGTDGLSKREMP